MDELDKTTDSRTTTPSSSRKRLHTNEDDIQTPSPTSSNSLFGRISSYFSRPSATKRQRHSKDDVTSGPNPSVGRVPEESTDIGVSTATSINTANTQTKPAFVELDKQRHMQGMRDSSKLVLDGGSGAAGSVMNGGTSSAVGNLYGATNENTVKPFHAGIGGGVGITRPYASSTSSWTPSHKRQVNFSAQSKSRNGGAQGSSSILKPSRNGSRFTRDRVSTPYYPRQSRRTLRATSPALSKLSTDGSNTLSRDMITPTNASSKSTASPAFFTPPTTHNATNNETQPPPTTTPSRVGRKTLLSSAKKYKPSTRLSTSTTATPYSNRKRRVIRSSAKKLNGTPYPSSYLANDDDNAEAILRRNKRNEAIARSLAESNKLLFGTTKSGNNNSSNDNALFGAPPSSAVKRVKPRVVRGVGQEEGGSRVVKFSNFEGGNGMKKSELIQDRRKSNQSGAFVESGSAKKAGDNAYYWDRQEEDISKGANLTMENTKSSPSAETNIIKRRKVQFDIVSPQGSTMKAQGVSPKETNRAIVPAPPKTLDKLQSPTQTWMMMKDQILLKTNGGTCSRDHLNGSISYPKGDRFGQVELDYATFWGEESGVKGVLVKPLDVGEHLVEEKAEYLKTKFANIFESSSVRTTPMRSKAPASSEAGAVPFNFMTKAGALASASSDKKGSSSPLNKPLSSKSPSIKKQVDLPSTTTASKTSTKSPAPIGGGWGTMFAMKPGEWKCNTCSSKNPKEAKACLACETPRPETSSGDDSAKDAKLSLTIASKDPLPTQDGPKFSFGAKPSEEKKEAPPSSAPTGGFSFGAPSTEEPKSTSASQSTFSFGTKAPPVATEKASVSEPAKESTINGGFSFGAPKPSNEPPTKAPEFSFGSKKTEKEADDKKDPTPSTGGFTFGAPAQKEADDKKDSAPSTGGFTFGAPAPSTAAPPAATAGTFSFGSSSAGDKDKGKADNGNGATTSFTFGANKSAPAPAAVVPSFPLQLSTGDAAAQPKKKRTMNESTTSETQKSAPSFSFGGNSTSVSAPAPAPTPAAPFTFGAPTPAPAPSASTSSETGTTTASKPAPSFSFGNSTATTSKPTSSAPSFSFGNNSTTSNPPTAPSAPSSEKTFSFGAAPAPAAPAPAPTASTFSFGSSTPAPATVTAPAAPPSFGTTSVPAAAPAAPTMNFGSAPQTQQPSSGGGFSFGATPSVPTNPPTFGAVPSAPVNPPAFGAAPSAPPANPPTFGAAPSAPTVNPPTFGAAPAATPGFGGFGAPAPAPIAQPSFGAPAAPVPPMGGGNSFSIGTSGSKTTAKRRILKARRPR